MAQSKQISNLGVLVQTLSSTEKALFDRIFHVQESTGTLVIPDSMIEWISERFGSVDAVRDQHVTKVTNVITMEGTLFNALRQTRPIDLLSPEDISATIEQTRGGPFCNPEELTPMDILGDGDSGRVRGKYCITASNIAKYDGYHGLIIFDEHNPLVITTERVQDYISTALRWAKRAHNADQEAKYMFLMWNCLWKGGASVVHGHMQVVLGRGMHYAHVEHWRRQSLLYSLAHSSDYFDDLYRVHEALGLGFQLGQTRVLVSLTPVKEKEILLVSPTRWVHNEDFQTAVGRVLDAYVHALGVQSFNMVLFQRPIDTAIEDWDGFPAIIRIVDRGDLQVRTADIGCMEIYGSSVVSGDPFATMQALRKHIQV